jgi:Zn-dependent peptidase ImmA (M78 family)
MTTGGSTDRGELNTYDTLLIIQQRQEWLKNYLVLNSHEPLEYVGLFSARANVKDIVNSIRAQLELDEDWAMKLNNDAEAVTRLSEHIENIGISVMFNGVVANNTSRPIPVEECRGFVLVDRHAPCLFVNSNDAKTAQMFTLLHELAHVWIGKSVGFNFDFDFNDGNMINDPAERLCDRVAAHFLVPGGLFNDAWEKSRDFYTIAKRFKVSPVVIARRAMDTGKITREEFSNFYAGYRKSFASSVKKPGGGGDFYRMTKKKLGSYFAAHVKNAVKSGQLLYRDAYNLTSLTGNTFDHFFFKGNYV